MNMREFDRRLSVAIRNVEDEVRMNRGDGSSTFARGIAAEGYAGGYRDALYDVAAILSGGHPSDPHRYWRKRG